jgi:hypothetical protein
VVDKLTSTFIAIEQAIASRKCCGWAISPSRACPSKLKALGTVELGRPVHITTDKKVEIAVVLKVEKRCAGVPALAWSDSMGFGNVCEFARVVLIKSDCV